MTIDDLVILTQNCRNLVELSLLGCPLLNSDSQQIISRGWPGLVSIHIEECGEVTANGVFALLDCKALEDLLLRHNESYNIAMSEKYGENSSTHPIVDPELWLDVAGLNKKGQIHGTGNNLHIGINNTMHASSSEVVGLSCFPPLTQVDIIEAVNVTITTMMTSFVETQLVLMLAPILSTFQAANIAPQAPLQGETAGEGREYDDEDEANLD